jgi:hypothetical protein
MKQFLNILRGEKVVLDSCQSLKLKYFTLFVRQNAINMISIHHSHLHLILYAFTFICSLYFLFIGNVIAYGSLTPTTNSYRIVGIPGSGTQLIPHSYVTNFRRWKLSKSSKFKNNQDETRIRQITTTSVLIQDNYPLNQQKLLVSNHGNVQIRPTLHFLMKSGIPAYVMAGIQIRDFDSEVVVNIDGDVDYTTATTPTEPTLPNTLLLLAQQWTSFAMLVEPKMRMVVYYGPADGTDERLLIADSETVRGQVEQFGMILSQNDDTASSLELASGFHLITFLLKDEWTKIFVQDATNLTLTCVLTGEADAREVFTLDKHLIEMTATSLLQVKLDDYCQLR